MSPSEGLASRLYDLANWGLIVGLVVGIVSTVLVVWMGNVKEGYLRKQVAGLNDSASLANERTAKIEEEVAVQQERAAKAERELLEERRNTANRDISAEDQGALSETLKAFAGQRATIDVFPVTFEHVFIAQTIFGILLSAKWNVSDVVQLPAPAGASIGKPLIVQGMWVQSTPDDRSKKAATALFESLKSTVASGTLSHDPLPNPNDPRVWVYIGDKPTPLRSWVK